MDIIKKSEYLISAISLSHSTALCGAIFVIAGVFWLFQRHHHYKLPPGPPVYIPGFGHLMKLAKNPLEEFKILRKTYGDVFRLYMGTRLTVVISGYEAINEVFQNRGPEFAYRPSSFLADKIAQNKGLTHTSGKVWNEQKANLVKYLRPLVSSGGSLDEYFEMEIKRLCEKLTATIKNGQAENVDLIPYIRKSVCATAFFLVFGRVLEYDSQKLALFSDTYKEIFEYLGTVAVVNFIPYIYLIPGDPVKYHRCLEVVHKIEEELLKPEIRHITEMRKTEVLDNNGNVTESMKSSNGQRTAKSLVEGYIEEMEEKRKNCISTEMCEEHLLKTAGDLLAGSNDTVSCTLQWLLIQLIHNEDVQEKCRDEIINALTKSGGRLTNICRSDLVYTQATIMEVQRLANVAPIPPVHTCQHDSTIRGYDIPKDTIIMMNMDSLLMGPHVGDNPEKFRPERFIGADGLLMQPKWFMPYATGSRMCIGANVAKKELLAFTVGLLSKFKFTAANVDGYKIKPSLQGNLGLTHSPISCNLCLELVNS